MKLSPTKEQSAVMSASANIVKVKASAGSGKTSTIKLYSDENTLPSIYLAFNKSIATEVQGKLGAHVTSKTTHSLAYKTYGNKIRNKLSRPKGGYVNVAGTPSEIAKFYKLQPIMFRNEAIISANALGLLVKKTVDSFQASADAEVNWKHVSKLHRNTLKALDIEEYEYEYLDQNIIEKVLRFSIKLWEERVDPKSKVLANHDTYLKMYQLSKPKLPFEIVYLDEAQDTSDCVLDIVMNQKDHARVVMVGDDFQAIYSWRGAINAMSKVDSVEYPLTKSFRFGNEIAKVARAIIKDQLPIKGNENIDSKFGFDAVDTTKKYTKIFRTNGALLEDAIKLTRGSGSVSAEVDTGDFIRTLESAEALFQDDLHKVKHDLIIPYKHWSELVEEAKISPELKRITKIVEQNQTYVYINALKQLKRRDNADIILTTAHKSKGREWDQVVLADDFPEVGEDGLAQEETNLLYVAVTRAVEKLNINDTVADLLFEAGIEDF